MKRKNKILIISLILFIPTLLTTIYLSSPIHVQEIPTRFITAEKMGFDLGPGNLNFGQIVPGYSASRKLTITNTHSHPTLTKITSSGPATPYIIVSENNFNLQPYESKTLSFLAHPPEDLPHSEYPATIIIKTYRA